MSSNIWTLTEVDSNSEKFDSITYRFTSSDGRVAIQEVSNSTRTVDIVEKVLYQHRSMNTVSTGNLHRILATPFERVDPEWTTRFRGAFDPGVYYCAESVETAACEFGFHKLSNFLKASPDLERLETNIIMVTAAISTKGLDIRLPPYSKHNKVLQSVNDYSRTQELGRVARSAEIGAITYKSARGETSGACVAILRPSAFKNSQPSALKYSWHLTVFDNKALWNDSEDSASMEFEYSPQHGFRAS